MKFIYMEEVRFKGSHVEFHLYDILELRNL